MMVKRAETKTGLPIINHYGCSLDEKKDCPLIVAYGVGTNSTATLCGLCERNIRPDYIVFADTEGEKPWTYDYLDIIDKWCKKVDFPRLTVVKYAFPQQEKDGSLENECLRLNVMPSKAFGKSTCSDKWKIEPQNRFAKSLGFNEPTKLIGFDFGEPDRADKAQNEPGWIKKFPLIEWFWDRGDCIEAIKRQGLPLPGKSSCFFCPSSKKHEILSLPQDLLERALKIEELAFSGKRRPVPEKVKGLARNWSWRKLVDFNERQLPLFDFENPPPVECGCYDG